MMVVAAKSRAQTNQRTFESEPEVSGAEVVVKRCEERLAVSVDMKVKLPGSFWLQRTSGAWFEFEDRRWVGWDVKGWFGFGKAVSGRGREMVVYRVAAEESKDC